MLRAGILLLFVVGITSESLKDHHDTTRPLDPATEHHISEHHSDHTHDHKDDIEQHKQEPQTNSNTTDTKTVVTEHKHEVVTEQNHDFVVEEKHDVVAEKKHEAVAEQKHEAVIEPNHDTQPAKIPEQAGRQFQPFYQPFFPQPSGGFNMIRRQFGGGMDLLGDIVMMGMIGLPILGLLTVGSSSIANFLGFGSGSKPSSKRNKRSLKEKAVGAVEYAKNLWDVMEQLERAFEKYDLYQAECRLLAVCEAHQKRLGTWGQTILDLMRKQKELEKEEILPVSRFIFSNYADAAQIGNRGGNCEQLYTGCPHHLFFNEKENEVE